MGGRRVEGSAGRLGRGGQKGGFKIAFAAEIEAEIEALIGPETASGIDFEAIETAVRRQALVVAARAVECRLNADESDHAGPTLPCRCGKAARYAGRRKKTFRTVLGEMTLLRAYYHCEACRKGFCPRDRDLGMEEGSLSPALVRMTGLTASMVSFAEGETLLRELGGVAVDTKQVERTAEALGREIAEAEQEGDESGEPLAPTMYLGMDGTGLPMRKEYLAGRAGKQPDGSSKTREVKLVTTWTAESRNKDGTPERDDGSVTYSAAIESAAQADTDETPSAFAERVERQARRTGFDKARRQVVLGDGAPWIWNLADERFPDAIQIVDRFHVKQHLSDVGKVIYGATSDTAATWAKRRCDELDEGRLNELMRALRRHAETNEQARKCAKYIHRNRQRMRYPEFRKKGLCTSTGVVEAGCKLVVGTRLKRAGMHWTLRGANAIIALRCCILSGRFEDFWERRAERHAS